MNDRGAGFISTTWRRRRTAVHAGKGRLPKCPLKAKALSEEGCWAAGEDAADCHKHVERCRKRNLGILWEFVTVNVFVSIIHGFFVFEILRMSSE